MCPRRGGGVVAPPFCSGAVTDTAGCGCTVALLLLLSLLVVGFLFVPIGWYAAAG